MIPYKQLSLADIFSDCQKKFENMDELIYLTFELTDENGKLNMLASDEITLNVKNATLLGMGSANPTTLTNFFDTTWETYEGRLQAVLRKENDAPVEIEIISKYFGTMHKKQRLMDAKIGISGREHKFVLE